MQYYLQNLVEFDFDIMRLNEFNCKPVFLELQIHEMWYDQVFYLFLFAAYCDFPFGSKLFVRAGSNGWGIDPGGE